MCSPCLGEWAGNLLFVLLPAKVVPSKALPEFLVWPPVSFCWLEKPKNWWLSCWPNLPSSMVCNFSPYKIFFIFFHVLALRYYSSFFIFYISLWRWSLPWLPWLYQNYYPHSFMRSVLFKFVRVICVFILSSCSVLSRFSRVRLSAILWTVAHQARILKWIAMPSSRGIFSTQGLNPGLLRLLHSQAGSFL